MNSNALPWLRRRCGSWRSERRYLFKPDGKPVICTTMLDIEPGERGNQFLINWTGNTSGTMEIELNGDRLERSRDYFGDGATSSDVHMLDDDTFVMMTTYGGTTYREEIRLINNDEFALRQTIGFDPEGQFRLSGQYIEFRLP